VQLRLTGVGGPTQQFCNFALATGFIPKLPNVLRALSPKWGLQNAMCNCWNDWEMNNSSDAPDDVNPAVDAPRNLSGPAETPRDAGVNETTLSNDKPHVVYDPLPESRGDIARQRRAFRRVQRNRRAPAWVKKIPWFIFPVYGIMRFHDPNYEEHYAQWVEQQRREYDQREPQ